MIIWNDLRYALRAWLARPGFALAAVAALAIAIGANVTVYSVARSLLLSPIRGVDAPPDRLVELGRPSGGGFDTMSYPTLSDVAAQATTLDEVYGYSIAPLNVRGAGATQRALGLVVSENYFDAFGVRAAHGRLLTATDAKTAREAPLAVASHAAFTRWFGGDAAAVGRSFTINGKAFTLAGVAAPGFRGHIAVLAPDFFIPLTLQPLVQSAHGSMLESRTSMWLLGGARLAPSATIEQAQAELATISSRLRAAHPDAYGERFVLGIAPLRGLPGEIATAAAGFSGVMALLVAVVLLIACVNVAGMLVARGETRAGETAMRYALGASRGRVIAQNLAESAVLAFAAGVAGLVLALVATRAIPAISLPTPFPLSFAPPLDTGVLAFALALTIATALLFGLLPALRVSSVAPRIGSSGRSAGLTRGGSRLRSGLVVGQVALGMLLLVAAGIFLRALLESKSIDPGLRLDGVVAADLDLEPTGYDDARTQALASTLLARARALPGVESAALVRVLPLTLSSMSLGGIDVEPGRDEVLHPDTNVVSDGFFETFDIALRGRGFAPSDTAEADDVVVVNARLAERLFGTTDAIGRTFPYGAEREPRRLRVVGVAADGKYNSLWEEPKLALWLPVAQWPTAQLNLVLATPRSVGDVEAQLRTLLGSIDRDVPAAPVHRMRDVAALSLLPQRIASAVAGTLGVVAALLAAIGLYGLVAYQVAARRREIGVRLALGASPRRIGREVAGAAARLIAIGLAIGLVLSIALSWLVASHLFGASAGDAVAIAGGALALVVAACLACVAPIRRAAQVAPIDALRDD